MGKKVINKKAKGAVTCKLRSVPFAFLREDKFENE